MKLDIGAYSPSIQLLHFKALGSAFCDRIIQDTNAQV